MKREPRRVVHPGRVWGALLALFAVLLGGAGAAGTHFHLADAALEAPLGIRGGIVVENLGDPGLGPVALTGPRPGQGPASGTYFFFGAAQDAAPVLEDLHAAGVESWITASQSPLLWMLGGTMGSGWTATMLLSVLGLGLMGMLIVSGMLRSRSLQRSAGMPAIRSWGPVLVAAPGAAAVAAAVPPLALAGVVPVRAVGLVAAAVAVVAVTAALTTALAAFGLPADLLPRRAGSLSGGERHRVALARLAVQDPAILLLDEPSSALDDANAGLLADHVRDHVGAGGSAIAVTHDPRLLERADDVLRLDG